MRTIVLIGVLAALCFSVGEGRRLLPPPFAPPGHGAPADSRPGVSRRADARRNQFKPNSLGLPPQAQKNLQLKRAQHAPPSGCAIPPPHDAPRLRGAQWHATHDLTA